MLYSTLESLGTMCLNWSLLYVDKHVPTIFKSNKIISISRFEVVSILGVAVSMLSYKKLYNTL